MFKLVGGVIVVIAVFLQLQIFGLEEPSSIKKYTSKLTNQTDLSSDDAIKMCNESFLIKPEYLEEMNKTGSFPDESDIIPMCFVKCYLEKLDAMGEEGDINDEKFQVMLPDSNMEMIRDCFKEMQKGKDICERAYYMIRCVMTGILINEKNQNAQ